MIEVRQGDMPEYYPEPPLVIKPGSFKGTKEELRELVLQQIEQHPDNFHMSAWAENLDVRAHDPELKLLIEGVKDEFLAQEGKSQCGTTLCIAGYAQLMVEGKITLGVESAAKRALGLVGNWLFYMDNEEALEELRALVAQDRLKAEYAQKQ